MSLIGIHIIDDNFIEELLKAINKNVSIIQLFINNMSSRNIIIIKNILDKHNILSVVHASYTINLAQNWNNYSWWIKQFINEIILASKLGSKYIVVHLGKQLKLTMSEALNNMYTTLLYVFSETKQYNVKILIETSTGQGTELCYGLEEFANFFKKLKSENFKNRFGICLDTCHIFAAGYNIKGSKNIKLFLDKFDKLIGIEHIKLVHLNDSKNDLNSKLDRHENLSKGFIGKKSLIQISKFFGLLQVPIILETPYDGLFDDLELLLK
jgi:deoxyribonuclease-4